MRTRGYTATALGTKLHSVFGAASATAGGEAAGSGGAGAAAGGPREANVGTGELTPAVVAWPTYGIDAPASKPKPRRVLSFLYASRAACNRASIASSTAGSSSAEAGANAGSVEATRPPSQVRRRTKRACASEGFKDDADGAVMSSTSQSARIGIKQQTRSFQKLLERAPRPHD